jgi:hypothetical protein
MNEQFLALMANDPDMAQLDGKLAEAIMKRKLAMEALLTQSKLVAGRPLDFTVLAAPRPALPVWRYLDDSPVSPLILLRRRTLLSSIEMLKRGFRGRSRGGPERQRVSHRVDAAPVTR